MTADPHPPATPATPGEPPNHEPATPEAGADDGKGSSKDKGHGSFLRELPFLIVVALGLALLLKAFVIQAFFIPSGSMEPTLHGCTGCRGDRVLVNKVVHNLRDVRRGEIVVFNGEGSFSQSETFVAPPSNVLDRGLRAVTGLFLGSPDEKDFIKRVIGVGGDRVVCCDDEGRVRVNDVAFEEPYVYPGDAPSDIDFDVTVPADRLWVMGDHRSASSDSRLNMDNGYDGTVPEDMVIGRAFVVIWPPGNIDALTVPDTFDGQAAPTAVPPPGGLTAAAPLALGVAGALPIVGLRRRVRASRRRRTSAGLPR